MLGWEGVQRAQLCGGCAVQSQGGHSFCEGLSKLGSWSGLLHRCRLGHFQLITLRWHRKDVPSATSRFLSLLTFPFAIHPHLASMPDIGGVFRNYLLDKYLRIQSWFTSPRIVRCLTSHSSHPCGAGDIAPRIK